MSTISNFSDVSSCLPFSEADDLRPPEPGRRWGHWTYDGRSLVHHPPHYEVDLARCVDAATTWDWVSHVAEKNWCTTDDLGNLVKALNRAVGYRLR